MKRKIILPLIVLLGIVIVFGRMARSRGQSADKSAKTSAVPVTTTPVTRGDLQQVLAITGSLEAQYKTDVASKISGKVSRILVDEGQPVSAGQVLVVLDQSDYRAQVAQAQAGVNAASATVGVLQAQYDALRAGSRPQEVKRSEESVSQAKASYDNTLSNYNRTKDLFSQGAISQQQMDSAEMQLTVAKSQYESAQQQSYLVKEGTRREDLRAGEEQVRQAEAGKSQALAALRLAQVSLDNTIIRSPINGVVAQRNVQVGEAVGAASSVVMTIVDNSRVFVRGEVSETSISQVIPGQAVTVTVDAYPGRKFIGKVSEVLPSSNPANRMFSVKIQIPNPNGELKDGLFARADIVTEQKQAAVILSRRALSEDGDKAIAFVVGNDNKVKRRTLTLGLTANDKVEVLQGVTPGEAVVISGADNLHDGSAVSRQSEEK
jgi:HlyD family secretion protein